MDKFALLEITYIHHGVPMFNWFTPASPKMVTESTAIPDNSTQLVVSSLHCVTNNSTLEPFPEHLHIAIFAMGCFWGAERRFWQQDGVWSTQVGYAGGFTKHPTYKQVCTGKTGHTEVVRVVFDSTKIAYETLLKVFWEAHDPTQGYRQGNDVGTQYRSAIYATTETQLSLAQASAQQFQEGLSAKGYGEITTEIAKDVTFFYAEDYHQQYLYKNPNGYCGLRGTGVECNL